MAAVLTGGAFCMFAVTALWLVGSSEETEGASVRRSSLQSAAFRDNLGSAPVDLPLEPDAAPRTAGPPEALSAAFERELAAGDEWEEPERDLLVPVPLGEPGSTEAPEVSAEPRAVADAGAPAPEVVAPERAEETRESGEAVEAEEQPLPLEPCGVDVCGPGLVCCNASCGTCVAPGGTCSQLTCSMSTFPVSAFCGRNTCSVGEVCCNLSCGICAPPGAACSQRVCD